MEPIKLYSHQKKAVEKLKSGSILYGGVGSGKTLTSLYFFNKDYPNLELIVITTAKKRDTGDWEREASLLGIDDICVDSWNNIQKYKSKKNCFFIFDEQRAIGYGAWTKAMIFIAKRNKWIMLTATPGDTWFDYMGVFIANGWYKHKTDFVNQHIEYDPWVKYPKVKKIHNEQKLLYLRNQVLVPMHVKKHTTRHKKRVISKYDIVKYNKVFKDRWNPYTDEPIQNVSEFTHTLRRVVSENEERIKYAKIILDIHDKIVVFYNYNYELEILIDICKALNKPYAQWNGFRHDDIPYKQKWAYLVQYNSGSEGWNCTETKYMMFYSMNYSYRMMEQSEGRIDRLNTPFKDLEYFYLTTNSSIERSIEKAINSKKKFNESAWAKRRGLIF